MEKEKTSTLKALLVKAFKENKKDYPNIRGIAAFQNENKDAAQYNLPEIQKAIRDLRQADEEAEKEAQSKRLGGLGGSFDEAVAQFYCATPQKGAYVFNNKGTGYGPDKVLEQGAFSGPKGHPAPNWLERLAERISSYGDFGTAAVQYKQSPAEFTDKLPMLSTGPVFNSTIGSGPAWAFAIPMPTLQAVDQVAAANTLNAYAANLGKPPGWFTGKLAPSKGWVLQSSDGTLNGSFVCFHKEDEETAFVSNAFALDGVAFRATHAPDESHQGRWKLLKDYKDYAALCEQHRKAP